MCRVSSREGMGTLPMASERKSVSLPVSAASFFSVVTRVPAMTRSRSEEHTSELQSLMRISYAVFCLKKKTHTNHIHKDTHQHNQKNYTQINQTENDERHI